MSDYLESGRAEGDRTRYKVIKSLNDLWAMVVEFTELVRQFPSLVEQACTKLLELISIFNRILDEQILGSGAYNSKKLASITAKHLCKSPSIF
jgi:hypothetical protein